MHDDDAYMYIYMLKYRYNVSHTSIFLLLPIHVPLR